MKAQQVYTEVSYNSLTPEQRSKIVKSRWVLRQKGNTARARIVTKGYTADVQDNDNIHASTPIVCVLRLLLTMPLVNHWKVRAGDISTAFLHAKASTNDLFMFPPTEFYNPENQVVWKLNKAICGLRSSPNAWQKHLAETPQKLGMKRLQRTQRVQNSSRQHIRPLLRGRSPIPGRANSGEQTVYRHTATPSTPTNRRPHRWQHSQQSTFLAETSPTKATTLKSAWQTATQQNCSTKQAWPTARQHRHREQRPATRIQNKHPMLRNTQHTDEQSASYSG